MFKNELKKYCWYADLGHPHVASSCHHAPQLGSQSQSSGSWATEVMSYELYLLYLAYLRSDAFPRNAILIHLEVVFRSLDRFSPKKFSLYSYIYKNWCYPRNGIHSPKKCSLDSVEPVHRGVKASGIPSRSIGCHAPLA